MHQVDRLGGFNAISSIRHQRHVSIKSLQIGDWQQYSAEDPTYVSLGHVRTRKAIPLGITRLFCLESTALWWAYAFDSVHGFLRISLQSGGNIAYDSVEMASRLVRRDRFPAYIHISTHLWLIIRFPTSCSCSMRCFSSSRAVSASRRCVASLSAALARSWSYNWLAWATRSSNCRIAAYRTTQYIHIGTWIHVLVCICVDQPLQT